GEAGRIELGVVGTAMWGRMRPVMRRFLRENPNVDVLFREKMPAMQMALLERRELDAGIWRMATEPPTGFTSLRLHESAFQQGHLHRGHLFAKKNVNVRIFPEESPHNRAHPSPHCRSHYAEFNPPCFSP
ncbi:LysR substrate-binding domain-containing protein, partial [Escherichia sp. SS-MK2]